MRELTNAVVSTDVTLPRMGLNGEDTKVRFHRKSARVFEASFLGLASPSEDALHAIMCAARSVAKRLQYPKWVIPSPLLSPSVMVGLLEKNESKAVLGEVFEKGEEVGTDEGFIIALCTKLGFREDGT